MLFSWSSNKTRKVDRSSKMVQWDIKNTRNLSVSCNTIKIHKQTYNSSILLISKKDKGVKNFQINVLTSSRPSFSRILDAAEATKLI